ncbi:MAG: hypothetical protein H6578_11135 [Chitinophagales bacterium]|nr:hypothetical protein [Chitinophagales bacterium]
MKRVYLMIIFLLSVALVLQSCSQDKIDKRNLKGDWQRNIADFSSVMIDTVSFDRKHYYSKEGTFKYYLEDNYLILEKNNGEEWTRFEYTFETKERVHLQPMFTLNQNITLFKID